MADTIPHAVLSEQLEELIDHRRILAAVFLTFEFDPGFFEQQILPVLVDVPLSHAKGIRLVQLEDALRSCAGRVAVYYDADRLVSSEAGSAHLDVQRIPVRHGTGVFHPKNIFLLVEETDVDDQGRKSHSLLVGAMSANLTRPGWWENVECAHFEEVAEGDLTRLKGDLQDLLHRLKQRTADGLEHTAVDEILQYLRRVEQRVKRFSQNEFQPHFYSGKESFPDFLEQCGREWLSGSYLEIISPYTDDSEVCGPLEELIRRFEIREARVMLPRNRNGEAACSQRLYEAVRKNEKVKWGKLPASLMKARQASAGAERFVHAKMYRFFRQKPKRELCFVGSVNLTTAAHQRGGNWETGLLVEVACPSAPEFWLVCESERPPAFEHVDETEPANAGGTPLMLRYRWDQHQAGAYWDAKTPSPRLTLEGRNQELGQLEPMQPGRWYILDASWADRLEDLLKETSFVQVRGHSDRPGLLLIQEEGMAHKPSRLFQLTVGEILRYWAMLTPSQRSAFLEAKAPEAALMGDGAELMARFTALQSGESLFDRFAGYFLSFNCLRDEVRQQLKDGRLQEADYRLFGRKYDSLGTVLELAGKDHELSDDVNRYIVFMCARQLCRELSREFREYWQARRSSVAELETSLSPVAAIRGRLAAKDAEMPAFLDWFDEWFLARATPREDGT